MSMWTSVPTSISTFFPYVSVDVCSYVNIYCPYVSMSTYVLGQYLRLSMSVSMSVLFLRQYLRLSVCQCRRLFLARSMSMSLPVTISTYAPTSISTSLPIYQRRHIPASISTSLPIYQRRRIFLRQYLRLSLSIKVDVYVYAHELVPSELVFTDTCGCQFRRTPKPLPATAECRSAGWGYG